MAESDAPLVGIIMGSVSDMETMAGARDVLEELHIPFEMRVVSAHRTPEEMFEYAHHAARRGLKVIIAGAGGAAHLPGMTASKTLLPVIGVPVQSKALNGLDSLLSIVQMPRGVPVATVAIGNAANAALLAARILALGDTQIEGRLAHFVQRMHDDVTSIKL
jgi:5-(carboxyamino)imidazole ribonucleotide mutase